MMLSQLLALELPPTINILALHLHLMYIIDQLQRTDFMEGIVVWVEKVVELGRLLVVLEGKE
jgi:hypothetical protein